MAHTLFISDLHLDPLHQKSTDLFLNFMDRQAREAEAIYILGDFFEVWIGDDDRSSFNNEIVNKVKELTTKGIKVYFQHGNRDFMIGKRFAKTTGCVLLPEFKKIDLYGKKVLLTHGDALCTDDHRHMRFRKYTQNKILQKLVLMLPLKIRRKIGEKLRLESKRQTKKLTNTIMDVVESTVLKIMKTYDADYLVHGHTHRPAIFTFASDDRQLQRIVLGSWEQQGSTLKWSANGDFDLIFFD